MHLLDPLPYAVAKYRSRRVRAAARSELLDGAAVRSRSSATSCFRPSTCRGGCPARRCIFTHNVESEIWRRHAETKPVPLGRLLYGMQHRRMLRYEAACAAPFRRRARRVGCRPRHVRTAVSATPIRRPVHVVPTGVDTEYFAPDASRGPRPAASSSRARWTGCRTKTRCCSSAARSCPLIRAEEPERALVDRRARADAGRQEAGRRHTASRVTGRVDDVRPYMQDAAVYIVPLRIGGGTRLKIFEAMAMGKAVVSTTVGAEGLPVTHGEHVLLADEPHAFARAVVRLMRDVDRRRAARSGGARAGRRALRLVGGRRRAGRRLDARRHRRPDPAASARRCNCPARAAADVDAGPAAR